MDDLAKAKQMFVDDIRALQRTYGILSSEDGFSRQTTLEFSDAGVSVASM